MILTAFDRGDISAIMPFLSTEVRESFEAAIKHREDQGLTIELKFIGVSELLLQEATFDSATGVGEIVMRFTGDPQLSKRAAMEAVTVCRRKILFDHAYDLSDTTAMYCTELIRFAYLKVGVDLTGGKTERVHIPGFNGDYLFPSQIMKSPFLREIERF